MNSDDVQYTRNIIMTGYSDGIYNGTSSQINESKIFNVGFDSACNNSPLGSSGYQLQFSRGNTTIGGKLDIKSTINLFNGNNNTISIDGYTRTIKMGNSSATSPSITLDATNGTISCNSLSVSGTPITFNTISSGGTTLSLGNNIINTASSITTTLPVPSSKGLLITIYSPQLGYTLNDGNSKTTSILSNVVTVCITTGTSAGNWAVYASGDIKSFA